MQPPVLFQLAHLLNCCAVVLACGLPLIFWLLTKVTPGPFGDYQQASLNCLGSLGGGRGQSIPRAHRLGNQRRDVGSSVGQSWAQSATLAATAGLFVVAALWVLHAFIFG